MAAQDSRYCVCAIGWRKAGQWGTHERCIRRLEARGPAVIAPLPGFVVSRSSSGQDNEKKACRTAATAISAGPTTPGLTRFGFPPQEPRLIDPSTAVSAPLARVSREPRGTFHLPTRMRATTNMHSCGRRRQRLVRWRDYRLDSRPTRRPCSPHATVHRPARSSMPLLDADNNVFVASC